MAVRLGLTIPEQVELAAVRDHAPRAYLRERAWALMWVAAGCSSAKAGREHRLRERRPETVLGWLRRYRAEGVAGLHIRQGRGRKPAFPPCAAGGGGGAAGAAGGGAA